MVNNEPLLNEFQDKFEQNMKLVLKEPGLKSTELLRYYNNKLEEFHADPFSLSIDQFLYNVSTDLTLGIDESRIVSSYRRSTPIQQEYPKYLSVDKNLYKIVVALRSQ